MSSITSITEADILERIVASKAAKLSPAAARDLLKFRFDAKATADIRRLLQKNNRGTITPDERLLLDRFLRVGRFLDLVHAKARMVLHSSADDA